MLFPSCGHLPLFRIWRIEIPSAVRHPFRADLETIDDVTGDTLGESRPDGPANWQKSCRGWHEYMIALIFNCPAISTCPWFNEFSLANSGPQAGLSTQSLARSGWIAPFSDHVSS
jgi:hypothetical protein